ncbi:MAG: hypothetical protein GDA48_18215 [Hormoscilla sp. GM102CHS1]|nr:hypothetical protein [Hormoscilla sp. GM102CHS1]
MQAAYLPGRAQFSIDNTEFTGLGGGKAGSPETIFFLKKYGFLIQNGD